MQLSDLTEEQAPPPRAYGPFHAARMRSFPKKPEALTETESEVSEWDGNVSSTQHAAAAAEKQARMKKLMVRRREGILVRSL